MRPFDPAQTILHRSALDEPSLLSGHVWEEARIFLAVAKCKSFSKAAETLGLSTPTVSRKVKRLQDYLHTQLLASTTLGTQLTPAGEDLVRQLGEPQLLGGQVWEEARIFLAVAKGKSFARAAEAVGQSTPTVSRKVKRLQDHLKTTLLLTTAQGTQLTPAGEVLAHDLAALDHKLFSIMRKLIADNADYAGLVRVSVTEGLAGVFVARNLPALQARHPRLQVHLKTPIHATDIRQNQCDIMIGFEPIGGGGVECASLGTLHFLPIASAAYIERHGAPSPENLERHLFVDSIYYRSPSGLWDRWTAMVERGRVTAMCDSSLAYGIAVRNGLGIGALGSYILSDPVFRPLNLELDIRVPIYILALSERINDKSVRAVFDWLSEIFGPQNPWFAPEPSFRGSASDQLGVDLTALLGAPIVRP